MWRKPTVADLEATLDPEEAEAFSASSDITTDVLANLLGRTAGFVRSFLRHNPSVSSHMGPDGTIPEDVMSPAMDYLVVDVLKRISVQPTDIRIQARKDAMDYFKSIADGTISPEPHGDPTDAAAMVAGSPASYPATPAHLLD